MMRTTIKLQNGNIIDDVNIRKEVLIMLGNGYDTTNYQDKLITKVDHYKTDDGFTVIIKVT